MAKSEKEIKEDISNHLIACEVEKWDEVYVGIAEDVQKRLFTDHKVDQSKGIWIYRQANSSDCARNVEQDLLNCGAKGGPGGGSDDTTYVYAYKIESYTEQ